MSTAGYLHDGEIETSPAKCVAGGGNVNETVGLGRN